MMMPRQKKMEKKKKKELGLVYSTCILFGVGWGRRDFKKSVSVSKSKGIFRVQKSTVERISV